MTVQKSGNFDRLAAHVRRGAMAVTLVIGSAAGAMASPMTQSFSFGLATQPIATFDTTLGTLNSIDISLSYLLEVSNPFINSPDRIDDWCTGSVTGAEVTVGTPDTSTLMVSTPRRSSERGACDTFSFNIIETGLASVDPSLFDAFTSAGPSELTLLITRLVGDVTVTAETPTETRLSGAGWRGGGQIAYTYTPVTTVPEPTTAVMLTLGLAGILARRRYRC